MNVTNHHAVDLKKLGYNEPCQHYYYLGNTGTNKDVLSNTTMWNNWNEDPLCASAPEMHNVIDWLYKNKGIFISVEPYESGFAYSIWVNVNAMAWRRKGWYVTTSPEHALCLAIDEAIYLLKNDKQ